MNRKIRAGVQRQRVMRNSDSFTNREPLEEKPQMKEQDLEQRKLEKALKKGTPQEIYSIVGKNPDLLPIIEKSLSSRSWKIRKKAAMCYELLARSRNDISRVIPKLVELTRDERSEVGERALDAIFMAASESDISPATDVLKKCFESVSLDKNRRALKAVKNAAGNGLDFSPFIENIAAAFTNPILWQDAVNTLKSAARKGSEEAEAVLSEDFEQFSRIIVSRIMESVNSADFRIEAEANSKQYLVRFKQFERTMELLKAIQPGTKVKDIEEVLEKVHLPVNWEPPSFLL